MVSRQPFEELGYKWRENVVAPGGCGSGELGASQGEGFMVMGRIYGRRGNVVGGRGDLLELGLSLESGSVSSAVVVEMASFGTRILFSIFLGV